MVKNKAVFLMTEANYYTKKEVTENTKFTIVLVRKSGAFQQEYGFLDESGCLVGLKSRTVPYIAANGFKQASNMVKKLKIGAEYNALPAVKDYSGSYMVERASDYVEDKLISQLREQLKSLQETMRRNGQFIGQIYENRT